MILFLCRRLKLFEAMECLKNRVDIKYHRLILKKLPTDIRKDDNTSSEKILNGPEMSRTSNESTYDSVRGSTSFYAK